MKGIGELTEYDAHLCEFTLTYVIARCIDDCLSTVLTACVSDAFRTFQIEDRRRCSGGIQGQVCR